MSQLEIEELIEELEELVIIVPDLSLKYINDRIKRTICHNTLEKLKDENLINEYKLTPSVKKEIEKLQTVLQSHNIDPEKIKHIIDDYTPQLIPPGTKGVVKGNLFNKIVKEYLIKKLSKYSQLEIKFEKKHTKYTTEEIPDFYIYNTVTDRIVIGMNQLDLWTGGAQTNRGTKYINYKQDGVKLLCVVANFVNVKSEENKVFKLFNEGFRNDSLCYLKELDKIIKKFLVQTK